MNETHTRTEIASLGEFGLIDKLTQGAKDTHDENVEKGIGDDAAVVKLEDETVVTTDLLLEGIHFDMMYTPLKHLGFKCIAVNVSDICAMNAIPKYVTVSLGLSNRFSVEAIEELYEGIYAACKHFKVSLIGGDTSTSIQGLMISVTAIGTAKKENICYRNGVQIHDLLCVSGDLGASYLGLQLLEREKQVFLSDPNMKPKLNHATYLLQRHLKPDARLDIVEKLRELNIKPTAMIDISDGLSSEMWHLANQSKCGFRLYEDKLPIHDDVRQQAFEFGIDATLCAMSGGEDYELLFTIHPDHYQALMHVGDLSIIGYATAPEEGLVLQSKQGNLYPIKAQGWNAFQNESTDEE
jgi:thiamine-monophosphate kinase